MIMKRFLSLAVFLVAVLFSYAVANAQNSANPKQPPAKPDTATTTATNPRVVVTDSLSKPSTPATQADKPVATTTKFGSHSLTITEGVTGQSFENGKWLTVTTWDGTRWASKRTFFPNKATTPPNP